MSSATIIEDRTSSSSTRKRPRFGSADPRRFLDIEADVVNDDEEDENEDEFEGFIDDNQDLIEHQQIPYSHLNLALQLEREGTLLSSFANRNTQTRRTYGPGAHGNATDSPGQEPSAQQTSRSGACDSAAVPPSNVPTPEPVPNASSLSLERIPPQEGDWDIWEVPVNVGSEAVIVYRILQRVVQGMYHSAVPPRSAFSSAGIIGRVYVEARQLSDVVTICKGMFGVRWWETRFITKADGMNYLNRRERAFVPRKHAFVRLKYRPYKGDLAFILGLTSTGELRVAVLPRINFSLDSSREKRRKRQRRPIPPAQRFNVDSNLVNGPELPILRTEGSDPKTLRHHYKGYEFDSTGFLIITLSATSYYHIDVYPSLTEITPFMDCISIPNDVKLKSFRLAEGRELKQGDTVKVVISPQFIPSIRAGENLPVNMRQEDELPYANRIGIVDHLLDSYAYIRCCSGHLDQEEEIQVPLHYLRRHFKIGDTIRVKGGTHEGYIGHIVSLNETDNIAVVCALRRTTEDGFEGDHIEVSAGLMEFIDLKGEVSRARRTDESITFDMVNHGTTLYENLPALILRGPLKGRSGMIKSVNVQEKVWVELRGSHSLGGRLQEVKLRDLAFELDIHQWYEISGDNQLTIKPGVPEACSILATKEVERSRTPDPDFGYGDGSDNWRPNFRDNLQIPLDYWFMRLPYRDTFGKLLVCIQSHGTFEDGRLDNVQAIFKGLDNLNVQVYAKEIGANQRVHCLQEGKDFGARFRVKEYGITECTLTAFRGGHKGKALRKVQTVDLATINFFSLTPHHSDCSTMRKNTKINNVKIAFRVGMHDDSSDEDVDSFNVLYPNKKKTRLVVNDTSQQQSLLSQLPVVDSSLEPILPITSLDAVEWQEQGDVDDSGDDRPYDSLSDSGSDSDDEGEIKHKPVRKQGMSAKMGAFLPHLPALQQCILQLEIHPLAGMTCTFCKDKRAALYRCMDCFDGEMHCAPCLVHSHSNNPFHHVQEWNGTHFSRTSLGALGLVIRLGHQGQPCSVTSPSCEIAVVHTNGIHWRKFQFCYCKESDASVQLMGTRLFPATLVNPGTVFTFAVLEDFHRHSLSSKTSAYDYMTALKQHTNAAFPVEVADRYRLLMSVMRVWRHLTQRRRSGQEHGIDSYLPHRRPGSLAIRCPSCPEVGFNIDADTIQNALNIETHKYTFHLSLDGNFRLQQKRKNNDPEDFALNDGNAYFVNDGAFRAYLDEIGDNHADDSMCASLKAVRQQEVLKFKNMIISGIIAAQCARHGFYLPQGVVDLRKGESYARVDYALAHALGREAQSLRWIMLSYDIWCQYSVNLPLRMRSDHFPWMHDVVENIRGAVPRMHIHGHDEKCQLCHSFMYTPYSGMTCGEGIESSWSEQNHASGSTREQSGGHRHDSLDDFNGYWNWSKLIKLSSYLNQQYKKYAKAHSELSLLVTRFEQRIPLGDLEEWRKMEVNPPLDDEGRIIFEQLYRARNIKVPTQQSQVSKIVELKSACTLKSTAAKHVLYIEEGILIEKWQLLLSSAKNLNPDDTETARTELRDSIDKWRSLQREVCPDVLRFHVTANCPEKERLLLPSSFDDSSRKTLELANLSEIEYELRLGQAYDAIDDLRTSIYSYNSARGQKRKHIRGIKQVTRANAILFRLTDDKHACARVYRLAYTALRSLGLNPGSELEPLHRNQLWGRDMMAVHQPDDSARYEPWWWFVGKPGDVSDDAWKLELDRVRWFRMRAKLQRMYEELEMLNEEFRRAVNSFTKYRSIWSQMGDEATKNHCDFVLGMAFKAYAYRQAAMYQKLGIEAQISWNNAVEESKTHQNKSVV